MCEWKRAQSVLSLGSGFVCVLEFVFDFEFSVDNQIRIERFARILACEAFYQRGPPLVHELPDLTSGKRFAADLAPYRKCTAFVVPRASGSPARLSYGAFPALRAHPVSVHVFSGRHAGRSRRHDLREQFLQERSEGGVSRRGGKLAVFNFLELFFPLRG